MVWANASVELRLNRRELALSYLAVRVFIWANHSGKILVGTPRYLCSVVWQYLANFSTCHFARTVLASQRQELDVRLAVPNKASQSDLRKLSAFLQKHA